MSKPFKRTAVTLGCKLVFSEDESLEFIFRGMGHDGYVVAQWVGVGGPTDMSPVDVTFPQKFLRIPDGATT